jgi:hypothetical protein
MSELDEFWHLGNKSPNLGHWLFFETLKGVIFYVASLASPQIWENKPCTYPSLLHFQVPGAALINAKEDFCSFSFISVHNRGVTHVVMAIFGLFGCLANMTPEHHRKHGYLSQVVILH